jgi:hypothetical protein
MGSGAHPAQFRKLLQIDKSSVGKDFQGVQELESWEWFADGGVDEISPGGGT